MPEHAEKSQDSQIRTVARQLEPKRGSSEAAFSFVDNRPEALAQRKLQERMNHGPQAQQAAQLRARIDHSAPVVAQRQQVASLSSQMAQRQAMPEEEELQRKSKADQVQRQSLGEEELLQGKSEPVQEKENNTGLPHNLKSGIENLSGTSLDDVRVHYNSSKPAQLQALAYTQGTEIHVGPGQEQHLPHEAWHVVQQQQGRVKPTVQTDGVVINDSAALEQEAGMMGEKASRLKPNVGLVSQLRSTSSATSTVPVIQRNIIVGRLSGSLDYWLRELDPDGNDLPRRRAVIVALCHLDSRTFGTEEEFLRAVAAIVAPLEREFQTREIYEAEEERERSVMAAAEAEGLERLRQGERPAALEPQDPHAEFKAAAKVGLELTFNSEESRRYVTNEGFPSDGRRRAEAQAWWRGMLTSWTRGIPEPEGLVVDVVAAGTNKELGNGTSEMSMCRVVYTDHNTDFEGAEEPPVVFWWQLSMDPGVVEIQTCPVTGQAMEHVAIGRILRSIYVRAAELGFRPGGGGGHVNVDFETGFGGDYSLIPKIIAATDVIIDNLRGLREDEGSRRLVDFENEREDPTISTARVEMQSTRLGAWDLHQDPREARDRTIEWEREVLN